MLILVVWTLALLSVLVTSLGSRGAEALGLAERLTQRLQTAYLAAAGVQRAVAVLDRDATPEADGRRESWFDNEDAFRDQVFGHGRYTIHGPGAVAPHFGLQDEDGKLSLNAGEADIWSRLLQLVGGLAPGDADEITDALLDWRDPDQDARRQGAEDFYYLGQTPSYPCKDAPFERIEELLLVKGITPALYTALRPYVTVYGSGRLNLNTADPLLLEALGVSAAGVRAWRWYRAGEDGEEATEDDRMLLSGAALGAELDGVIPAEDINRLVRLEQDEVVGVGSLAFSMTVEAAVSGAPMPHLDAVVDRAGRVLAWREY